MVLAERFDFRLAGMSLGIVGVGNVGSRVLTKATALGMKCVLNDPPLERQTGDSRFRPIRDVFDCDIVTLHVPYTKNGPDATHHLADEAFIRKMKPEAILINSSRGSVADGEALKRGIDEGHLKACVLDVWENEPSADIELLKRVAIGTPHIAGYSFDGKVNGTRQIYEAACKWLGTAPTWDPSPLLPEPECPEVAVAGEGVDTQTAIRKAVLEVYDVRRDHRSMGALLETPDVERGAAFDDLRKRYPRRREFLNTVATVTPTNAELEAMLAGIGFQCGKQEA
jgi:erythronate-4-phosphate dehydrogenase